MDQVGVDCPQAFCNTALNSYCIWQAAPYPKTPVLMHVCPAEPAMVVQADGAPHSGLQAFWLRALILLSHLTIFVEQGKVEGFKQS
jgi:hypothetical protein